MENNTLFRGTLQGSKRFFFRYGKVSMLGLFQSKFNLVQPMSWLRRAAPLKERGRGLLKASPMFQRLIAALESIKQRDPAAQAMRDASGVDRVAAGVDAPALDVVLLVGHEASHVARKIDGRVRGESEQPHDAAAFFFILPMLHFNN